MKTLIAIIISLVIFGTISNYAVSLVPIKLGELGNLLRFVLLIYLMFRFHSNVKRFVESC